MDEIGIWDRLIRSRLFERAEVEAFQSGFRQNFPANAQTEDWTAALNWLESQERITAFQRRVFLSGRDGPFRFGDYCLRMRIEAGVLKGAYESAHVPSGHPVVLLFAGGSGVEDARRWQAMHQLARNWRESENGFVWPVYEAIAEGDYRFVVLPAFRGKSLVEKVAWGSRVPWLQTAQALEHLTLALKEIHESGRVHGNIHPAWIWVQKSAVCQLIPPLVLPGEPSQQEEAGYQEATLHCCSPWQRLNSRAARPCDDLFALGQIALRLLTGKTRGFESQDPQSRAAELESVGADIASAQLPMPMRELLAGLLTADVSLQPLHASSALALIRQALEGQSTATDLDRGPKTRKAFRNALAAKPGNLQGNEAVHSGRSAGEREVPVARIQTVMAAPSTTSAGPVDYRSRIAGPVDFSQMNFQPVQAISSARASIRTVRKPAARTPLLVFLSVVVTAIVTGLVVNAFSGSGPGETSNQLAENANDAKETSVPDPVPVAPSADPDVAESGANGAVEPEPAGSEWFQQSLVDSEDVAWESPTAGAPLDLSQVPPSPDIVVVWKPSRAYAEGKDGSLIVRALGPDFAELAAAWQSLTGLPPGQVAQMTVSLHPESGTHHLFVHASLAAPVDRQTLAVSKNPWTTGTSPIDGVTVYENGTWQIGLDQDPADERRTNNIFLANGKLLDTLQPPGAEARCDPAMLDLVARSDSDRDATVLLQTSVLASEEGGRLFHGPFAAIRQPLRLFFHDHVRAVSLSMHADEESYLELMLSHTVDLQSADAAGHLRQKLAGLRDLVAARVEAGDHEYWGPLQKRFASMVAELVQNTRVVAEKDGVIANCWLPEPALHNLLAGAELAIAVGPGTGTDSSVAAKVPATLEELLEARRTLKITNSPDLKLLVEDFQNEIRADYPELPFPFSIRLMGEDLQADGITQNQRPGNLDLTDKTVAEILTEIMLRANPDKNASGTRDERCKLVWVIAADPDQPGQKVVLITTRTAVAAKGYELPPAFRPE